MSDGDELAGRRRLDIVSITDEAGFFDLGVVHRKGLSLAVTAHGYGPILDLRVPDEDHEIEVEVFAVRKVQVDASLSESARFVALLDREGQRLVFQCDFAGTKMSMAIDRIIAGRTAVLETTAEAEEIEVIHADGTTTRHALDFTSDAVTIVRLGAR